MVEAGLMKMFWCVFVDYEGYWPISLRPSGQGIATTIVVTVCNCGWKPTDSKEIAAAIIVANRQRGKASVGIISFNKWRCLGIFNAEFRVIPSLSPSG